MLQCMSSKPLRLGSGVSVCSLRTFASMALFSAYYFVCTCDTCAYLLNIRNRRFSFVCLFVCFCVLTPIIMCVSLNNALFDLQSQLHDLKQSQNTENAQLQSKLIDPAVNLVFQRMKTELAESKEKLEQAQNDLSAWKFTPDRSGLRHHCSLYCKL